MSFWKKSKDNDWYYKAQKAFRKGKLPAPYDSLFEYYNCMNMFGNFGGSGHFDFFSVSDDLYDCLDKRVEDLRSVLPTDLLENFNAAYDIYVSMGNDSEHEDDIDAFDELDIYAFDHYKQLETLLKEQIDGLIENCRL
ncbi:MAG: hypothetical protein NC132_04775 [Corallococcus sp.]|nr:hypothetical protein [Corallococcus sp.]MCM1359701.1 hypothetical protein [Corallococcus sp.]MCM1395410.1 hypothetical protein [Corallococcus sp.]